LKFISWTRFSGYQNVWNVMNVDGKEVTFLMENHEPVALIGLRLTLSPKTGLVREARELAAAAPGISGKAGEDGGKVA
jgi:hypothetical protein